MKGKSTWQTEVVKPRLPPRRNMVKPNERAVIVGWKLADDGLTRVTQKLEVLTVKPFDGSLDDENPTNDYRKDWIHTRPLEGVSSELEQV